MEGDGPIMGSAKPMGLIVVGTNNTAVDATLGRIMEFDPAAKKTSVFREPSGKANGLMIDQQGRLIANAPHMPVHLGSMGESVETIIAANASAAR